MKQPELFAPPSAPLPEVEVAWLVDWLRDRDWQTATQILQAHGQPVHESTKRRIRLIASGSRGRIAGAQKGYKLVESMTSAEYQHWRNWLSHQASEMQARVVSSDRIFYGRKSVAVSVR
jgi:hypothetical protein